jgi:hypothetical protein
MVKEFLVAGSDKGGGSGASGLPGRKRIPKVKLKGGLVFDPYAALASAAIHITAS